MTPKGPRPARRDGRERDTAALCDVEIPRPDRPSEPLLGRWILWHHHRCIHHGTWWQLWHPVSQIIH